MDHVHPTTQTLHLADLRPDPRNPRRRSIRASRLIETSLREVGPARSVVVDEENTVLAGNGVVEAAAHLGLHRVLVVTPPPDTLVAVRRTDLDGARKRALAIYDNRTAELAEWDPEALAGADAAVLARCFTEEEREALREAARATASVADALAEAAGTPADAGLTDVPLSAPTAGCGLVFWCPDFAVVERALGATGDPNRGRALARICEAYLAARTAGQPNGHVEHPAEHAALGRDED